MRTTKRSACGYIISLCFIAQHVIDKKLVLSLTWLSFLLVPVVKVIEGSENIVCDNTFDNCFFMLLIRKDLSIYK